MQIKEWIKDDAKVQGLRSCKDGIAIFCDKKPREKQVVGARGVVAWNGKVQEGISDPMEMQSRQLDNQVCSPYRRSGLEI